jgi:KipI family sensor histidine kinase inhibitor
MRFLPYGAGGLLVELDDPSERRRLEATLRTHAVPGVLEHVPAARTVLLRLADGTSHAAAARRIRELRLLPEDAGDHVGEPLEVPVRYDGADLPEVARMLDISAEDVVARHTGQVWTVEFCGFAPGFGYLVGERGGLEVTRRDSPRTRIPAGAVALADQYTAVYPRSSPGGWRLIGTTSLPMWDARRDPPALLWPGRAVRFVPTGGRP